jgi:hypothetical protein
MLRGAAARRAGSRVGAGAQAPEATGLARRPARDLICLAAIQIDAVVTT